MDSQLIFVLTAASATGKTSCAKLACAQIDALKLSISHSTRPPRPGEQDGVDKYFITPEQFERYRELGEGMGFRYIASGPLVRSSYKAGEFFIRQQIESEKKRA